MATLRWNGSTNDWKTGANWTGGSEPTTSDDIIFDDTSTQDCTQYNGGALDVTGQGTWASGRKITIMPGYTGTIGGTGNPLKIDFGGTLTYRGGDASSEFWFETTHTTGVAEAKLAPAGTQANACRIDGEFIDIDCMRGKVQFEDSATIDSTGSLRLISDGQLGGSPLVDVPNGVTVTGTEVFVLDGRLITDVAWPMLVLCGNGYVEHSGPNRQAATIAELIQGGGEFVSKLGTVTLYHIHGGRFDGAKYATWTVTTMHAMREAIVDLKNGMGVEPGTLNEHVMTTGRILRD